MKNTNNNSSISPDINKLIDIRFYGRALKFPPQQRVMTNLNGGYSSHFKGRGIDFDEVRNYQPGDDIRNMDWRVTARTGNPHTKIYKEERERPIFIAVDFGKTMQFGTKRTFKSVAAAESAALFAWSAANNKDRVGGIIFSDDHHLEIKPGGGDKGVLKLINALCHYQANSHIRSENNSFSHFDSALKRIHHVAKPGSAILIISDFSQLSPLSWQIFSQLAIHNDLILISISDPIEHTPPPPGIYGITDGSNTSVLDTGNKTTSTEYKNLFQHRQSTLKEFCKKRGILLFEVSTATETKNIATDFFIHKKQKYRQKL